MENKIDFRGIIIKSIYFSVCFSFLILIMILLEERDISIVLTKVISAILLNSLISCSNVGILLFLRIHSVAAGKKKFFIFYGISLTFAIGLVVASHLLGSNLPTHVKERVAGNLFYLYIGIQATLLHTIVLLFQGFLVVQDSNNKTRIENLLLKSAQSEANYQMLLQQIHPHFLFNALNILRALYKTQSVMAEDYLVHLSQFLRASLTSDKSGTSPLSGELELCKNYLEMQKIRFGEALLFTINVPDQLDPTCLLPVFSIQSLVENAIKHNGLTESDPLKIVITQEEDWITVRNNIKYKSSEFSNGQGLTNLSERYRLLSGENIKIFNDGKEFCVSIRIIKAQHRPQETPLSTIN